MCFDYTVSNMVENQNVQIVYNTLQPCTAKYPEAYNLCPKSNYVHVIQMSHCAAVMHFNLMLFLFWFSNLHACRIHDLKSALYNYYGLAVVSP